MIYELWELVSYDNYYEPLILIDKNNDFNKIYKLFVENIKLKPCAILINLENK